MMNDGNGTLDVKRTLNALLDGVDLEGAEMEAVIGAIMDGGIDPVQTGAILAALRAKGESGVEVAAAARAMRERALAVRAPRGAIDTCGTGGDGADTINISTASAIAAAAGGVPVAKHGNRAVSSSCGSADVLEALGVRLDLTGSNLERVLDEVGIAFLFAQVHHPATKAVVPVRKALGVRTVFNLLGPLTNPAGVTRQVMGVWGRDVQPLAAEALAELGAEHAWVIHSDDGLDELSVLAPSSVIEVRDGVVVGEFVIDPDDLGIHADDPELLRGGDAVESARRLREILEGRELSAASEAIALNTAAALVVGGAADSVAEGLKSARGLLASGEAGRTLQRLEQRTQELGRG